MIERTPNCFEVVITRQKMGIPFEIAVTELPTRLPTDRNKKKYNNRHQLPYKKNEMLPTIRLTHTNWPHDHSKSRTSCCLSLTVVPSDRYSIVYMWYLE